MIVKKTNAKCAGCSGDLSFDPSTQHLICTNCKSEKDFEKIHSLDKSDYIINADNLNNEKKSTNCVNCGAKLEINEREITKQCPYCNNNFVLELDEISGLKPDLIIPFQFDKNTAIEKYKKNVKKKLFLPNKFKKSPSFTSIYGTYISSFSFDSHTESEYKGRLAKTKTYRDSNGHTYSRTTYQNISGNKTVDFKDIIVEASSKTEQILFEQIKPYTINEETVYKYNPDFIRGYSVETNDNTLTNCKLISENLMKEKIKNLILSRYNYDRVSYFNLTTNFSQNKYSYMLVPVYFININYKNKNFVTYLNGQTGKLGENLPKSKVKIFFTILISVLLFISFIVIPIIISSAS